MARLLLLLALLAAQDPKPCEKCGTPLCVTAVRWAGSPSEAAKKAKEEEKLVFVVHTTGLLDPKGALANADLGAYLNKHYVSALQRLPVAGQGRHVGTIVSYFCAPDGRVLHAVAGAVDAATLLREATWTVDSAKQAIEECRAKEVPFKAVFRRMHAERLRREHGLVVEPVTFEAAEPAEDDPLTWRDPSGRPMTPPPLLAPPIDGPDVQFRALAKEAPDGIRDRKGCCWRLTPQAQVHQLLAAHALVKIERLYPSLFSIAGRPPGPPPFRTVLPVDPERRHVCMTCDG